MLLLRAAKCSAWLPAGMGNAPPGFDSASSEAPASTRMRTHSCFLWNAATIMGVMEPFAQKSTHLQG